MDRETLSGIVFMIVLILAIVMTACFIIAKSRIKYLKKMLSLHEGIQKEAELHIIEGILIVLRGMIGIGERLVVHYVHAYNNDEMVKKIGWFAIEYDNLQNPVEIKFIQRYPDESPVININKK